MAWLKFFGFKFYSPAIVLLRNGTKFGVPSGKLKIIYEFIAIDKAYLHAYNTLYLNTNDNKLLSGSPSFKEILSSFICSVPFRKILSTPVNWYFVERNGTNLL